MKKTIFWLLVIVTLLFLGVTFYKVNLQNPSPATNQLTIGDNSFAIVEVADTPAKRAQGLAGREPLKENEAMLFRFDEVAIQTFWMKGVTFPIDIIWIMSGEVVGFEKNVPPQLGADDLELKLYSSPAPVNEVLEIKVGSVEKLGIEIGDEVATLVL